MTPDRWRQIEDLYHAAQKCHSNERAALLECTDPEIRSRVERMLALESGSQILDQPPDGLLDDPTQTIVALGAQLGPYKIEAQIGAGGMGTVYRAIDTRLGRVVAIKIAAERYSERFQLEARAISTLNHPHVCTLYDVGPNYLVMEFIEGSTLAAEIKKGPLAPEMAARYGAQIASALAEAHALGIVHRDLKPSNVMVTRHGVKVLDFGLAKLANGNWHHRNEWRYGHARLYGARTGGGARAQQPAATCSPLAWFCTKCRWGSCRFLGHRWDRCFRAARTPQYPRRRASALECRPAWMRWSRNCSKKIPPGVPSPRPRWLAIYPPSPTAWPPRFDPAYGRSSPSPSSHCFSFLPLAPEWLYRRSTAPGSPSPIPNTRFLHPAHQLYRLRRASGSLP